MVIYANVMMDRGVATPLLLTEKHLPNASAFESTLRDFCRNPREFSDTKREHLYSSLTDAIIPRAFSNAAKIHLNEM